MTMPSKKNQDKPGRFDRLADAVDKRTSKASFFAFCLGLVAGWALSYPLFDSVDTWQLIINTSTTIITFLLVALGANTAMRAWNALHAKLNAVADGLAHVLAQDPGPRAGAGPRLYEAGRGAA